MIKIFFKDSIFDLKEVFNVDIAKLSEFQRNILIFCKSWLYGDQQFSFNTSGSTGVPKTLVIQRNQMLQSAQKTIDFFNLQPNKTCLLCLNADFIAGKMMLVRALEAKMNIIAREPSTNLDYILDLPFIDFVSMVPIQLQNNLAIFKNKSVGAILLGGAPVSFDMMKEIQKLSIPVYLSYGMTETVSHIAIKKLNGINSSNYFEVLPKVELEVDDRNCLMIKADVTNNEWLTTNDCVELIDKNKFIWLGRADFVINSGGIKIYPESIEDKIREALKYQLNNCEILISSLSDTLLGQRVILIVESTDLAIDLHSFHFLEKYYRPKEIYYLDSFIFTPTNKVDRIKTLQKLIDSLK